MSSQRNTGAFIIGGVLGGIVGAALTLWNTPKSGEELRATLSGGSSTPPDPTHTAVRGDSDRATTTGRFSNPVLSFVERAAAPIVGVELGKLAKHDSDSTLGRPVRTSAADARPPSHGDEHVPHDQVDVDHQHVASTDELTSPPSQSTGSLRSGSDHKQPSHGDERVSHDEVNVDDQHVATIDELTSPPPQAADPGEEDKPPATRSDPSPFPNLEHNDRT